MRGAAVPVTVAMTVAVVVVVIFAILFMFYHECGVHTLELGGALLIEQSNYF